jgi:hypothetical protein
MPLQVPESSITTATHHSVGQGQYRADELLRQQATLRLHCHPWQEHAQLEVCQHCREVDEAKEEQQEAGSLPCRGLLLLLLLLPELGFQLLHVLLHRLLPRMQLAQLLRQVAEASP